MTAPERQAAPSRPRPQPAIDARHQAAATKVASVETAVKLLGRTGAPITRASVAKLAGVSRSFTYENEQARALIGAAQTRTNASAEARAETTTAQQEASWRARALNAEDEVRRLRQELTTQRRLVSELMGQLREPDGTWVARERERLRTENEQLFGERNQLVRERDDLRRRLDGARAQVSRLGERRVAEMFPGGPGPTRG
jgi:chromosome segregation ATPase